MKATLIDLLNAWRGGKYARFDYRRLSAADRKRAQDMGMIKRKFDGRRTKYEFCSYFRPGDDLPVDVLFEVMKGALQQHSGYSINKNPVWSQLDIYPEGSRYDNTGALMERERVLARLDRAGYINWQAAGSVWRIDVLKGSNPRLNWMNFQN